MRGLRRAPAQRHLPGGDSRACAQGAGPVRRTRVGLCRRRPAAPDRAPRARDPRARHLLRHAGDGAGARRARRGRRVGRVRPDRAEPLRVRRPASGRAPGRAAVLDEPPRLRARGARGVRAARRQPRLAGRRVRIGRSRSVRHPVPPRGGAHPVRHPGPGSLPTRDHRLRAALVAGVGDRRAGREDPRQGRQCRGHLRPVGGRRLRDRRGSRPPGDRRSAHLRPRGSRPDAPERGGPGRRTPSATNLA